jgi:hypothetical protein
MGLTIVVTVRLLVPLAILRWPFAGSLLALAVDIADLIVYGVTGFPPFDYQRFDKLLDVHYIALQVIAAQRWSPPMRWTANILCSYRFVGMALYELTGVRAMLFAFPNVFTFWFILCSGVMTYRPSYEWTWLRAWRAAGIVLLPTLALEYALHFARWFDNLVAVDVIEDTGRASWRWLRDPLP